MPDNGVKLFAPGGDKLPDEVEDEIEDGLDAAAERPIGAAIGRVRDRADGGELYADHLLASLRHRLDGLHVVVDCAHGAASRIAPAVYRRAGARVTAINAEPDGLNINDGCGSTHLDPVRAAVREFGADVGIAHDGDADRCLAVTAGGELVDGDALLAICALAMRESRTLAADTIVVTVMSNLGLHQAMTRHGISVLTTPVGDRYVLEALRRHRLSLGGEQSGHLIFPALAGTGDGILTALALLSRVAELGVPLAAAASVLHRLPQVLVNVPVRDRTKVAADDRLGAAVAAESGSLGESGRVLLRPSGTEQLVRVMVEAPTHDQAQAIADRLATAVAAV